MRTAKNTSNAVSKARQCEDDLTRVAASAYFRPSRSSSGMCLTASAASRCSVNDTGKPERRSSVTNPERRSSKAQLTESSSLAARSMSAWYFNRMWSVSRAPAASMV